MITSDKVIPDAGQRMDKRGAKEDMGANQEAFVKNPVNFLTEFTAVPLERRAIKELYEKIEMI